MVPEFKFEGVSRIVSADVQLFKYTATHNAYAMKIQESITKIIFKPKVNSRHLGAGPDRQIHVGMIFYFITTYSA